MWKYTLNTSSLKKAEKYLDWEDSDCSVSYEEFVCALLELFDNDIVGFED